MNHPVSRGLCAALALTVSTLAAGCVQPESTPSERRDQPIIDGEEAVKGQFPTVVGLLLDAYAPDLEMLTIPIKCKRGKGICSATLIRPDVILTAAHCVTNLLKGQMGFDCPSDPEPPSYTFEPNLIAAARDGKVVKTRKVVVHPRFGPTMCTEPPGPSQWNDIALVFLDKPLAGVPLQRLPEPGQEPKVGERVRIVGYGKAKIDDAMGATAGLQRHGMATVTKVGTHELVVARAGEQQACQGDSGGPVIANPASPGAEQVQIGVASRLHTPRCPGLLDLFNPPKCEHGVFYTRVEAYLGWIKDTIAAESVNPPMDPPGEAPDLARPSEPDLSEAGPGPGPGPGEGMPPEDKGCSCSVGGAHGGGAALPLGLLGVLGVGWRLRRRRQGAQAGRR